MNKFKFNEKDAIENMIKVGFVDKNNVTNTIYSLAKYNYHILGLNDKLSYEKILSYLTDNCENIFESNLYKDIDSCIKSVKKHSMATIEEICITRSELNTIHTLNNVREEKVMFVILAVSKYFNALNNKVYDAAFLTNSDICKMARLTIPSNERDVFMQFAYDKGLLYRHSWCDSSIKKLTFVSHQIDDDVILRLNESDFNDLAYTYLAYLTPYKFRRCILCRSWIRKDSLGRQVCKTCSSKPAVEKDNVKLVECEKCSATFYVDIRNTNKHLCDVCYKEHRLESNLKAVKKYQSKE